MGFTEKLFGTHSQRELKRIAPIVKKIEDLRETMVSLSDDELKHKTDEFKARLSNGETLDDLLPEAFAVVREASRRSVGLEPFPVQLTGGIVLHQGRVAEMRTGEGKHIPYDTPMPTPEGWKTAGDIRVGDYLFDRDGRSTKVVGVYPQGVKDTYEISLQDGRTLKCGDQHLWGVYTSADAHELETLSTIEMLSAYEDAKRVYYLPVAGAVQYPESALPTDPYIFGILSSCGFLFGDDCLAVHSTDRDMIHTLETTLKMRTEYFSKKGICLFWKNGHFLKIHDCGELIADNLNRHANEIGIPEVFKTASVSQRQMLLRGFFEINSTVQVYTDANVCEIRYATSSPRLRDDLLEVGRSLGYICTSSLEGKILEDGVLYDRYCVCIAVPASHVSFLLRRVHCSEAYTACSTDKQESSPRIAIKSIRKLDERCEQVCFAVDNDEHLYLAGEYIVTHNTLVAALPSYLNALTGNGVHVITVNDYLAKRDADDIGRIHRFLGLSVGCVLATMQPEERKEQYACDITYITNNEAGFDYLRDNMVMQKEEQVQRDLAYAIIDEADSVLIDEARTPLIISGASSKSNDLYFAADALAKSMKRGEASGEVTRVSAIMGEEITETGDFIVNEKDKIVTLTAEGVKKVEKFFHIDNLADPSHIDIQHHMTIALKANNLMFKDQDYIVQDDQVLIVDEFTGRVLPGRRYSDGLHQAIEAKEHVKVKKESRTLATITFQNFFNKYKKKCGMTGTALTEEQEFRDIYGMDVIAIPTNKPVIRDDMEDSVYMTKKEKFKAVVEEIKEAHARKQPVLVGTITIETSELISSMLQNEGIPHQVLNAKYHEREAEIISHAGEAGAVTIATNMAGRGTDIKLDDEAKKAGGLKIIGTERHESRRIDNQLRGRSGRQGDPGVSKFFLSLEDDLMRLFGSDRMLSVFQTLGIQENEEIHHKMLSSSIEKAQKKIEGNNYGIRKRLLDYDMVNNEQRELIYDERNKVLNGNDMRDAVMNMLDDIVEQTIARNVSHDTDEIDIDNLNKELCSIVPILPLEKECAKMTVKELKKIVLERGQSLYKKQEDVFGEDMRVLERQVMLRAIDDAWKNHIDDMEQLRQGIGLQAYGQRDPKVEYKLIGFDLFNEMTERIERDTLRVLYRLKPKPPEEEHISPTLLVVSPDNTSAPTVEHANSEQTDSI